ncbi:MAG: hypothetical protein V2A34_14015 [Lentisphaerota bacterium]
MTKSRLKSELLCKQCGASWKYTGTTIETKCPFCGATKDARDRSVEAKQYLLKHPKRMKALKKWGSISKNQALRGAKQRKLLKKRVFFRITGSITPTCVRCGCDDIGLLEVNHINGGGNKEMEGGKYASQFWYDIALGRRDTSDLEALCKACNAIHALEMRFGKLPLKVVWGPPNEQPK